MRPLAFKVCIVGEFSANQLNLLIFDPVKGEKRPLKRFEGSDWYMYNWTLSPDGSALALASTNGFRDPRRFGFSASPAAASVLSR